MASVMSISSMSGEIATQMGIKKAVVENVLKNTAKAMSKHLDPARDNTEGDNSVNFGGLFTAKVAVRSARKGRNPATGEEIDISEKTAIKFKPGKNSMDLK